MIEMNREIGGGESMTIKRVLVANRGEIARRIIQSTNNLGIDTIAYVALDEKEIAQNYGASSIALSQNSGAAAYLESEAIVLAALENQCDAIHPGYGFLSESPTFARLCLENGVTFIGPSVETLELLGDKAASRRLAKMLGVPTVPGSDGPTTLSEVQSRLESSNASLILKAISGGGGKGLRIIRPGDDAKIVFDQASNEAKANFLSGDLYFEELIEEAKHIEVQLIGDGSGRVSHLYDRDCSLQRNHQKLIEIAPAITVKDEIRKKLFEYSVAIGKHLKLMGLATIEFLVHEDKVYFIEANPRIQVEHCITEEILGVDLVAAAIKIAGGARLSQIRMRPDQIEPPKSLSIEVRICAEALSIEGQTTHSSGIVQYLNFPSGRGIRMESNLTQGCHISSRYDSLIAKMILTDKDVTLAELAKGMVRSLSRLSIQPIDTDQMLLCAILETPEFRNGIATTDFFDKYRARLLHRAAQLQSDIKKTKAFDDAKAKEIDPTPLFISENQSLISAKITGVVVEMLVFPGEQIKASQAIAVIESMKMHHLVLIPTPARIEQIFVSVGDELRIGDPIVLIGSIDEELKLGETLEVTEIDLDEIRDDLKEVIDRHNLTLDQHRIEVVEKRHSKMRRTARENIDDLCDQGSFIEYGALAIAAQRRRRDLDDLIKNTPADGIITGIGKIDNTSCVVISYDYTVLAGTQGLQNHRKLDRILEIARERLLPIVLFAEGGGGRPGDSDTSQIAGLDLNTFFLFASLSKVVPIIAIVSGYCFAGNAALAGCGDVIIATDDVSIGMGGPAMIEGGGLGVVAPGDIGPMETQSKNGVIDIAVPDEQSAITMAKKYLSIVSKPKITDNSIEQDQRKLRVAIPPNRLRVYEIDPIIKTIFDFDSVIELRSQYAVGIRTYLARIEGRSIGVMANNPLHLSGAIDVDAANKASRFISLCSAYKLPIISLCDTPGFMVGPDSERLGAVKVFGDLFIAGANANVPLITVVLRKGYGLGAMAMAGGGFKSCALTVSWPSGEFGGMGLEGAIRLGYRRELEAITDPIARQNRYDELLAQIYEVGKAISMASVFEIDDVIDPSHTRSKISKTLSQL